MAILFSISYFLVSPCSLLLRVNISRYRSLICASFHFQAPCVSISGRPRKLKYRSGRLILYARYSQDQDLFTSRFQGTLNFLPPSHPPPTLSKKKKRIVNYDYKIFLFISHPHPQLFIFISGVYLNCVSILY